MKKIGKLRILTTIALILVACTVTLLTACNGGGDDTTTPPEDTSPLENRAVDQIYNRALGLSAYKVESSNPRVASGNALPKSAGVRVVAHNEGTTVLTVYDYWGRSTTAEITVGAAPTYQITINASKCTDDSIIDVKINSGAFGNGSSNDTAAIQKAIDEGAERGVDVCIPAGIYIIDKLELREGSVVRLQGKASDFIGEGCMTDENYEELKSGAQIAVLRTSKSHKFMCINNEYQKAPTTGKSNIVFQGGVFDMQSCSTGGGVYSFVFTWGDNILLEDTAMLDCYNEHTIQVSGCTNVTIKNCIFAGYVYENDDIRREALQIESATKGCNAAATYRDDYSEKRVSSDVLIEGCYFGPTPENPAPPMGVGHHGINGVNGQVDGANITIRGCIFEECGYAAIRQPNSKGLVIEDNVFVVTGTSTITKLPTCIDLYMIGYNYNTEYTLNGRKIVISTNTERYGTDARITGNTFKIGGDTSNFRVLQFSGKTADARTVSTIAPVLRQDYTDGPIYTRRGFIVEDCTFHDIVFSDNEINISAKTTYTNAFVSASVNIYGFEYKNNVLTTANTYSSSWDGNNGLSLIVRNGAAAETRVITSTYSRNMVFTNADGSTSTMLSGTSSANKVTLKTDGNGRILLSTDSDGHLYVSAEGYEGYEFEGWFTSSGEAADISGTVSSARTIVAKFARR